MQKAKCWDLTHSNRLQGLDISTFPPRETQARQTCTQNLNLASVVFRQCLPPSLHHLRSVSDVTAVLSRLQTLHRRCFIRVNPIASLLLTHGSQHILLLLFLIMCTCTCTSVWAYVCISVAFLSVPPEAERHRILWNWSHGWLWGVWLGYWVLTIAVWALIFEPSLQPVYNVISVQYLTYTSTPFPPFFSWKESSTESTQSSPRCFIGSH